MIQSLWSCQRYFHPKNELKSLHRKLKKKLKKLLVSCNLAFFGEIIFWNIVKFVFFFKTRIDASLFSGTILIPINSKFNEKTLYMTMPTIVSVWKSTEFKNKSLRHSFFITRRKQMFHLLNRCIRSTYINHWIWLFFGLTHN